MSIDWYEVNKMLSPIRDYQELLRRLKKSFTFPFVRQAYNFTLPELAGYTQQQLGGDARARYTDYAAWLVSTLAALSHAGMPDIQDLLIKVESAELLEIFTTQSGIAAQDVVGLLKYLVFWVVPMEKYLSGLVRDDPLTSEAIKALGRLGIRTNLELLQQGINAAGRKVLADSSGYFETTILELVNRADFSRLPWASKATISNIIGAGYGSLAQLAHADPEQLYADFFRYGKAIGKNLKLGNEIENSYRLAQIVPVILQEG